MDKKQAVIESSVRYSDIHQMALRLLSDLDFEWIHHKIWQPS